MTNEEIIDNAPSMKVIRNHKSHIIMCMNLARTDEHNKVIDTVQEWIKDCTELTKGEMVVLKQYLSQLKEQK